MRGFSRGLRYTASGRRTNGAGSSFLINLIKNHDVREYFCRLFYIRYFSIKLYLFALNWLVIIMSLSRSKQNEIKHFILERIGLGDPALIQRVVSAYDISDKTVYRYIKELEQNGCIIRKGRRLSLFTTVHNVNLNMKEALKSGEDIIFRDRILPILSDLPKKIINIWEYMITGLLNNIFEHSEADTINIELQKSPVKTKVLIKDNGIGIFNKLRKYYKLQNFEDVILELYKGTLTTDPDTHSGDGLFFISRLPDDFAIISSGKFFSYQNISKILPEIEELSSITGKQNFAGTAIYLSLSAASKKDTAEILSSYSGEYGNLFSTSIPLGNIYAAAPVSRSQAKRLSSCFKNFSEVMLDFEGLNFIGQSFAHELFTVYAQSHPETKLIPVNISDDIRLMLAHVTGA